MTKISDKKAILYIVVGYLVAQRFFSCLYLMGIPHYGDMITALNIGVVLLFFINAIKYVPTKNIMGNVALLIIVFAGSVLWATILNNQSGLFRSIRSVCRFSGPLTIIYFFVFRRYNVSINSIVKSAVIVGILYSICYIVGILTFPKPIFGATALDQMEDLKNNLEQRGIIRLHMIGREFLPLLAFYVTTFYRSNLKYYLWLIPIFLMLAITGERGPLFVTMAICIAYYIWTLKSKFWVALVCIAAFFSVNILYQAILESKSDNIFVRYVQMTADQIDSNSEEEDIRVKMAKYMVSDFNEGNVAKIIFGNGFPNGAGPYANRLAWLSKNRHYYVVDVGYVEIFVYFGLLGLLAYILLLRKVIITKVPREMDFAKLMVYFFFATAITSCYLVEYYIFCFAMTLYLIYRSNKELMLSKRIV